MARVVCIAGDPDWLGPALRRAAAGRSYAFLGKDVSAAVLADALAQAEALIAAPADALAVQPTCPGLRFVQFTSCDYEQGALAELTAKGLSVAGAGAPLADYVARVAVGLLLALHSGSRSLVRPADDAWPRLLKELRNRSVGIIGLGRVGAAVAQLLQPHVSDLAYSDVRTAPQATTHDLAIRRKTQDRLLVESDFITVHVPLTDQSRNLLAKREFGLLRPETVLVNTSASEVVERQPLMSALRLGRLGGFGTTTLDPGMASFRNVVMVDPAAVRAPEVAAKVAAWIVRNVDDALGGRQAHGLVETIGFPRAGDPAFWSSRMTPRTG